MLDLWIKSADPSNVPALEQASAAVSALSLLACTMKASAAVVKSSAASVKPVARAMARHLLAGSYTSAQSSSTPW